MTETQAALPITETNEALVGVNELAVAMASSLKDGFQPVADVQALWTKLASDPVVSAKLKAAYEGIGKVPAELKDLDASEAVMLGMTQLSYVPRFIDALKK